MKKTYHKLVRDNIPAIIAANHQTAVFSEIPEEEFLPYLKSKLSEEVEEFLTSEAIDELADILEVLHAILKQQGVSYTELESLRAKKAGTNGAFEKRLLLEEVSSSD